MSRAAPPVARERAQDVEGTPFHPIIALASLPAGSSACGRPFSSGTTPGVVTLDVKHAARYDRPS
jgi:hypothetical protein